MKKYENNQSAPIVTIIVFVLIVAVFLIIISSSGNQQNNTDVKGAATIDSTGKQILDLTAKGGYFPNVINAKANIDSILRVKTNGTYDCSSAFKIPSLGVSKNLPTTGVTEIPIPAQKQGSEITGNCSMGMYYFKIKFL